MPNRDGSGPEGKGPVSGRGLGKCGNKEQSENDETQRPRRGNCQGSGKRCCCRKN